MQLYLVVITMSNVGIDKPLDRVPGMEGLLWSKGRYNGEIAAQGWQRTQAGTDQQGGEAVMEGTPREGDTGSKVYNSRGCGPRGLTTSMASLRLSQMVYTMSG